MSRLKGEVSSLEPELSRSEREIPSLEPGTWSLKRGTSCFKPERTRSEAKLTSLELKISSPEPEKLRDTALLITFLRRHWHKDPVQLTSALLRSPKMPPHRQYPGVFPPD